MTLVVRRLGIHASRWGAQHTAAVVRRAVGTTTEAADQQAREAIKVTRQKFKRFAVDATGASSLLPDTSDLKGLLTANHVQITPAGLQSLAHRFARINTVSAPVGPAMEAWRTQALSQFSHDLGDMTQAARVLGSTARNRSLAHALIKVAGEEGHWDALHYYAVLLGGRAIRQEGGQALGARWIEQLAGGGHVQSMLALADVLLAQQTQAATQRALDWARRAGTQGATPQTVFRVAELLRRAQQYTEAASWYARAARMGVAEAHFALGGMWRDKLLPLEPKAAEGDSSERRAFACFERAALGGVAEAQYNLGVCYAQGTGVLPSATLAAEYWAMAAERRFPAAALNLGLLYAHGARGIEKDKRRARDMLTLAVECSGGGQVAELAQEALGQLDAQPPGGVRAAWRRVVSAVRRMAGAP